MIVTKLALGAGVVLLGVACWMGVIGVRAASEGLLTVLALVALVAGGNALAGRSSTARRGPGAAGPSGGPGSVEPGGAETGAMEPGAAARDAGLPEGSESP